MTQVWPEDDGPDYDVTVAEGYCPDCEDGVCSFDEDDMWDWGETETGQRVAETYAD